MLDTVSGTDAARPAAVDPSHPVPASAEAPDPVSAADRESATQAVGAGLRFFPHRVALKLAGAAFVMSAVPAAFVGMRHGFDLLLVLIPIVDFAGVYAATMWIVGRRIDLARTVLRQIRKHRFENLEAAHLPRGDELNDLVWQVYRTGQVLEAEMRDLRQVESYRKEFLGNVSHELKTPIFAIRGFTETLLGGAIDDPDVNRTFLDKILRNADRLSNLAKDLGEISRIETGELKMEMVPFRLADLVHEILESLDPIASAKGIRIGSSGIDAVPEVLGDVERLRQVLTNLVDNAVKYNNTDGTVEVVARLLPDGSVKISVVDNGIGIPQEHLPRITERFYRVDRSRSRLQGGTGLGLAIVKHILAAHGTALKVESRPGSGSTFGFTLPSAERNVPGRRR